MKRNDELGSDGDIESEDFLDKIEDERRAGIQEDTETILLI